MIEISQEMRDANRSWWQRHTDARADYYLKGLSGKTPGDDMGFSSLENAAWVYANHAFDFLAGDRDDLAADAIERAIWTAEEALRTESYNRLYYRMKPVGGIAPHAPGGSVVDETFKPTPKQVATEKLCGRMKSLEHLHYALWFKTGERPMDLFRQSVDLRKECFVLRQGEEFPELLQNSVQAEDYEYAMGLAKKQVPRATSPPKNAHFALNEAYALFIVANYGLGRQDLEPYARIAVDHWYGRSLDWTHHGSDLPWWTALGWAYLRGRFFAGVLDSRSLIKELRGY